MPYNFIAAFFSQRNFVADFLLAKCNFTRKRAVLLHWATFGGLWTTCDDRWKACSGLPISVRWTFFARCYVLGATSECLLKIGDFAPTGAGLNFR